MKLRLAVIFAAMCGAVGLRGQEATTRPAGGGVLEAFSRESEGLYRGVKQGVVRVQLPPPKWLNEMAAKDNPVDKWGARLGAELRGRLEQERENAKTGNFVPVLVSVSANGAGSVATPTTQPAGVAMVAPSSSWRMQQVVGNDGEIVFHSVPEVVGEQPTAIEIHTGGERDAEGRVNSGGAAQMMLQPTAGFAPNNVGLVFDEAGHVLVPLYVEKETVGDGVRVCVGDGAVERATFVASDRQTNLTVLRLSTVTARMPIKLAEARPAEGAMVMLLAPNSGSAQWLVWNEAQQNVAGVVVKVDGAVAGFARYGQFMSAAACKPVVEQLVKSGTVKRALFGVSVRQLGTNDPVREVVTGLGTRPALRVVKVIANSAAARGGLQAGDLILAVNGEVVGDPPALGAAIAGRTGKTAVKLMRGAEVIDADVELDE